MKVTRILKTIIKYVFRALMLLLALVAVLLGVIQTPAGKRLLADGITALASSDDGSGVTFRSLSGFIPFRFGVGEFKISDPEGDWLVAEDISLRMDAGSLLLFRLRAEEVTAGRVTWRRLPAGTDDDRRAEDPEEEGFTPRDIPSFAVERLWIKNLTAEESLPGKRIVAELKGHVRNDSAGGAGVNLALKPVGRDGDDLTVAGMAAADLSSLSLDIKLDEEAGGNLGSLIIPGDSVPLSLRLHGGGPWEACRVRLAVRAAERGELDLDVVFDISRTLAEGTLTAAITRLPGPAGGIESGRLSARLAVENGRQNISARIEADGLKTPLGHVERIEATVDGTDILQDPRGTVEFTAHGLRPAPPGAEEMAEAELARTVTGRLTLRDTDHRPRADLEIQIEKYALPGSPISPAGTRRLTIQAHLEDGQIHAELDSGREGDILLQAKMTAKADFSLAPLIFRLDEGGPIEGELSARLDLSFLNNRLALSRQSLRGTLSADLTAGGTIRKPELNGEISLRKGEYQNLVSGTVLSGLTATVKAKSDRLEITELSARTPAGGKISLTGHARLSPRDGFPLSLSLLLTDAQLVDMEMVTAALAGKIDLEGSLEKSRLGGKITIKKAEGRIPSKLSSGVPEITVTEINKPGGTAVPHPAASSSFLKTVALDLRLTAPEDVFIKGRGLDSEWKADVTATGTADAPSLRGGITLLDGIFIFMGEELKLENCSIMMDGGFPPVPQLKINARIVKSDITITLQVVGPVNAPEVILSSQPPYPADEILARLLYGRPASQLSGLQALRIADGLRTLQGKGGILDRLTGWTSFLGNVQVDFTELEGSTDQTAVRVRWSLSKNFYVENQHSIDARDNLFLARWDLTRRLQLRTQSGYGFLGDAVYLRYQWDY
ncbi:MAG: translocation/assembly module TamB domain-containing protein [PVC group bacterium]